MAAMTLEELNDKIGQEIGLSDWVQIDQDRINAFADATLDHQFIHIDEERAKQTPFGGTVAHGYLTLSMLSHLFSHIDIAPSNTLMAVNYGIDKLRFVMPVASGKKVRARIVLLDITNKKPAHYLFRFGVTVEIESVEKPALVAEQLSMFVLSE